MDLISDKKDRKGQSMQILMFSLVIVGIGVGLLSFAQMQAAPQIFGSTMDDVPVISEAQSRTDDTVAHYIPLSAHYAMAQAVYETGQANDPILTYGQLEQHYENEIAGVEIATGYIFDNYMKDLTFNRCDVEIPEKELEVGINNTLINVTKKDYTDPFVSTNCQYRDIEVQTQDDTYEIQKNASNIRFHQLMVMTIKGLKAAHEKSETIDNNDDNFGTVTKTSACYLDGNDPQTKEEKAREEATNLAYEASVNKIISVQNKIEKAASDAVDNIEVSENEDTGIFGRVINFVTFWETDDTFDWNFTVIENSTDISEQSNTVSDCACAEYGCEGYLNDDTYEYDTGSSQCENKDEPFGDPNCDGLDGVDHDGSGSCETTTHPSLCKSGYTYNTTWNKCDSDTSTDTHTPCDQYTDYSPASDECVHDNAGKDATCDSDAATESNGNCVHDGARPDSICITQPVKAESETDWELHNYTIQSYAVDEKYEIPVEDGWENLEIKRKYEYDFPES